MPNNYILIDRIELNATAASVVFDNIPQTGYTDLVLKMSTRDDRPTVTTNGMRVAFNGSTSSFTFRALYGSGSGTGSYTGTNVAGVATSAGATANTYSNCEMYIPNYTSSNYKSYSVDAVPENNATTSYMELEAGLWSNTAAITSVTISFDSSFGGTGLLSGSTFSLYGIAQVGTTPAIAPKANGGNVIGTDGTYWYHAFLSNGTFTPQVALSADVLVVAGGGGGSFGGGGAGGALYSASQSLTATGYTCTIGAGGIGGSFGITATSGVNSVFNSLTATGGGYGGGANANNTAAAAGGSGGGSGHGTSSGGVVVNDYGTGTSGQGNRGGSGYSDPYYTGGGGGGAGAVGGNSTTTTGGAGGAGTNSYSSWLSAVTAGVSGYLAGGGGGAYSGSAGSGGGGSGGTYPSVTNGGSGVVNTGSGGGGANRASSGTGSGGAGGSGIVIIRYLVA